MTQYFKLFYIRRGPGLSSSCSTSDPVPTQVLEGSSTWSSAIHIENPYKAPESRLRPGPTSAFGQSLYVPSCQSCKYIYIFKEVQCCFQLTSGFQIIKKKRHQCQPVVQRLAGLHFYSHICIK